VGASPKGGRNDIRKVGTAVLVKDIGGKVRFGPAIVEDLDGENRGEKEGKNEKEFHS